MRQPSAEMIGSARRLRPGATDISVLGEGQLNVAVRVDDLVLRFPRSEFAQDALYGARQRDWTYVDGILASYG